jgi:thymidylate synthase (FAD)
MGTVQILDTTTRNPISLIGERAGVCWGANITDAAKNYKRGMDCIESGHGRTLEFVNVEMVLDGYSARVMREWYTHIGGAPTRLQASTRDIDYGEFEYVTPPSIAKDTAVKALYDATMAVIADTIRKLELMNHVNEVAELGFPREDTAMLLPLGMTTRVVDKRNLRNLIDMSRQRMCNRAYWEFRNLFRDICIALTNYSEEWGKIVNTQFHAKCDVLGYCPEKHGCGKYPKAGE